MTTDSQVMSVSDFNLTQLSTKELEAHVKATIEIGENIAIFGRRGTGKTEISKQQIKAAGLREVYLNLSVMERVDLGGYPNIMAAQQHKKFVDFLLPQFFQPMMEGDRKVVALLDEVDKADPSIWAPLLEFLQFKSINGTALPNLFSVIMTGNLISEGGSRPSPPLLDRSEKYLVQADATSWLDWGRETGLIHPSVAAFITDYPNDLFGAIDPEDRYADPSPRGWTRYSHILFQGEKLSWDKELLQRKAAGCIGKDAGVRYETYYKYYQILLPMIDDLYNGRNILGEFNKMDPSKQLVACMIICNRMITQLSGADDGNRALILRRIGEFMQHVTPEHFIASVRSQLTLKYLVKFGLYDNEAWKGMLTLIHEQFYPKSSSTSTSWMTSRGA